MQRILTSYLQPALSFFHIRFCVMLHVTLDFARCISLCTIIVSEGGHINIRPQNTFSM